MNQLGTVYATKRRRRNSKSLKPLPKDGVTKSNPSKRHRERLNAELDTLASLLPFEQSILSKLDKLSILRLSVSYLRTKSYFHVAMHGAKEGSRLELRTRDYTYPDTVLDGDLILQALNGFLLILACEGEVFFASHTIESYLGFHQSDIVHQSVYELVHSEDREDLQRQLMWNAFLPTDSANMNLQQCLQPENTHYLERSFTVRFRCLLDNTSGFLRLDIRGRIKVLHGQNRKMEEPPLALFAVCTPFGPPSLLEMPQKDIMFKSKHKLDLSLVSMDQRGKILLGYSDAELSSKGGYDLVHFDDLAYVASAHQELLKTGASGMIAYRVITKDYQWQWLQTSSRLVYKNSKPDFIICTHRPLIREEEGRDLLGKRTMDFKVSYLDSALGTSSYVDSNDYILRSQRNKRYKTQLRDFLSTCRKRKMSTDYMDDATAAYNNTVYYTAENALGPYVQQNLYPAMDNSRFLATDNFFQYRHHLGSYYAAEYAAHPSPYGGTNGFMPPSAYTEGVSLAKEEKLYPCQLDSVKYNGDPSTGRLLASGQSVKTPPCCDYGDPALRGCIVGMQPALLPPTSAALERDLSKLSEKMLLKNTCKNGDCAPNESRKTVLMWGSAANRIAAGGSGAGLGLFTCKADHDEIKVVSEANSSCKWTMPKCTSPVTSTSPHPALVAKVLAPPSASAYTTPPTYSTDLGTEVW
uniref:Aryl hydrocarbon receptor n=1 Tax=Strigamia maritima TaxID=126957 RepID=T1IKB1_STRMM